MLLHVLRKRDQQQRNSKGLSNMKTLAIPTSLLKQGKKEGIVEEEKKRE